MVTSNGQFDGTAQHIPSGVANIQDSSEDSVGFTNQYVELRLLGDRRCDVSKSDGLDLRKFRGVPLVKEVCGGFNLKFTRVEGAGEDNTAYGQVHIVDIVALVTEFEVHGGTRVDASYSTPVLVITHQGFKQRIVGNNQVINIPHGVCEVVPNAKCDITFGGSRWRLVPDLCTGEES